MPNEAKPAEQTGLIGMNKRQQVERANQKIFIWVAVASVVVALCAVVLQFLVKEALFNQKIISAKQKTNTVLVANIDSAAELKRNVDALIANQSLAALRANPSDSSLQVILDALPTTGDTTTFSNSLYNRILKKSGVEVSAVSVGIQDASLGVVPTGTTDTSTSAAGTVVPLPFNVVIRGSQDQVKAALVDIERVIRPINVTRLLVEASDGIFNATITGETYYLPKSNVDLGKVSIKP